jgi:micrococcal nuclease
MTRAGICAILFTLAGCGAPSPLPDMEPGETGRVTRVIDGDALVLETGQSVRLVSIEAPAMYPRDSPPAPYAGESARILEDMALGRRVQLFYPGITRDRYDRALAHVVTVDGLGPPLWLNQAMLEAGAARVRLYPSTSARGQDLLAAEQTAREAGKGLWETVEYRLKPAASLDAETRGFVLIEGELGEVLPVPPETQYPPACRRAFAEAEIVLDLRRDAASSCGLKSGRQVILRGYVSDGVVRLDHPWHLQLPQSD